MAKVAKMGKKEFENLIRRYMSQRPEGDRAHRRHTDEVSGSFSPMLLNFVPVGKMFFQGAPRLLKSRLNIQPCHPTSANGIILEAYPALVARKFIGRDSYKGSGIEREKTRKQLVEKLLSEKLSKKYQFKIVLCKTKASSFICDTKADELDALMCAIQAAWAYLQPNFGIPEQCDALEGWIVDPSCKYVF